MKTLPTNTPSAVLGFSAPFPSTGSINDYLGWINRVPLLTQEEEAELLYQLKTANNTLAARKLVFSHLRFVAKVARNYLGYGLAFADLIQEGTIGLMKAIKRFDPDRKVRLVTFAIHWIKAEIHDFILRNWRIVKIATTKAQRKLFFNLRRKNKQLNWFTEKEITAIADDLQVPTKEVKVMEARLSRGDLSLDRSDDEDQPAPIEYLTAATEEFNAPQEVDSRLSMLKSKLEVLDARSRDIVNRRWLTEQKATLQVLSTHYNISCERVRQIEEKALKTLKQALLTNESSSSLLS